MGGGLIFAFNNNSLAKMTAITFYINISNSIFFPDPYWHNCPVYYFPSVISTSLTIVYLKNKCSLSLKRSMKVHLENNLVIL